MKMTRLFKLLIFIILFSAQVFPQNISRLRAKKEREKSKRSKPNVEETIEESSGTDSLSVNILDEENPDLSNTCLLYTSPSPRDRQKSRMPSSA